MLICNYLTGLKTWLQPCSFLSNRVEGHKHAVTLSSVWVIHITQPVSRKPLLWVKSEVQGYFIVTPTGTTSGQGDCIRPTVTPFLPCVLYPWIVTHCGPGMDLISCLEIYSRNMASPRCPSSDLTVADSRLAKDGPLTGQ